MARPTNSETRRQQIVEGLMQVMSTSGYGGATIPLIAKAAGLTTGLVHYHFDTKQSILIELVERLTSLVDERFTEMSANSAPTARLTHYINANLAYGKGADPVAVACWISIGAEAVNQPEVRLAYQQATKHRLSTLENICEQILRAENRRTSKKREIALAIIAAIEGSYHLLIAAPELIPRGFAAPIVNEMARGLIAAQPVSLPKKRK